MPLLNWATDAFAYALLWMLIHSLWQSLMAAVIAGLIMHWSSKQSSSKRYSLLLMVFGCLLIAIASTFFVSLYDYNSMQTVDAAINVETAGKINLFQASQQDHTVGYMWLQKAVLLLNQNATTILCLWLTVMLLRTIRFGIGYRKAMLLRSKGVLAVNLYWHNILQELIQRLNVHRTIGFLQSERINVPMVIGHFKPIILVPLGFFNSLPPADIEAILVHELAHIRRCDFLVNMLQTFTEIIFFFNPALLWISSLIRTEREHCCDDIAIAHSGNKRGYINALVAFQEQNLTALQVTAFCGGSRTPLLDRVKRLIQNHNKTLSTMEKITLMAGVAATTLLAYAFNNRADGHAPTDPAPALQTIVKKDLLAADAIVQSKITIIPTPSNEVQLNVSTDPLPKLHQTDTTGKGKAEVNAQIAGKSYRLVLVDDKLVELYEDGVQIPESRFGEYDALVQKLLEQKRVAELHAKAAQEHTKQAEDRAKIAEEHARAAEERYKDLQAEISQAKQNAERAQLEAAEHAKQAKVHAAEAKEHAKVAQLHATIFNELKKDGLIGEHETNLNYSIKDGKFYINGKEQSSEVYRKYEQLIEAEKKRLGIK